MVQQEFARRLTAIAGTKDYGVLTIFTALAADAGLLFDLPPGAFRPVPKVRSSLVRLTFRPAPVDVASARVFEEMVRSMFTQRRKTLGNAARAVAESHGRSAPETLRPPGSIRDGVPRPCTLTEFARLRECPSSFQLSVMSANCAIVAVAVVRWLQKDQNRGTIAVLWRRPSGCSWQDMPPCGARRGVFVRPDSRPLTGTPI